MGKKVFLILICAFLLTGCDVTYDLTIDGNENFKEKVTMSFLKSDTSYSDVSIYKDNKTPITNLTGETRYYNTSINDTGNFYDLVYDYNHDINSIKNSYFINNCYNGFTIYSNDNNIVLNSGKNFSCYFGDDGLKADKVIVNVTTELDVLENNADEVNGNTYTWNINENNYFSKVINMTLKREKKNDLKISEVKDSSSFMFFIIAIAIIIVCGLVFLFIRWKLRKNNGF